MTSVAPSPSPPPACATVQVAGQTATIAVGGTWKLRASQPDAGALLEAIPAASVRRVVIEPRDLEDWDSSLLLFLLQVRTHAQDHKIEYDTRALPPTLVGWLQQMATPPALTDAPALRSRDFRITRRIGRWTQERGDRVRAMLGFLGECALGAGRVLAHPRAFRWSDCVLQMRRCGAQALGIVGLITFLVGVILAFVGATQFRQVGADVFVADLVGLAIFREMGPIMAAIVLAGRTGAAYAAELGNMRLNEEIDALETFGLRPLDFLVMPRVLALVFMMPLLTLYANFLGVAGGALVCGTAVDMNLAAFFHRLQEAVDLSDLGTGLLKSIFFGAIVAYAGCLKGMRAARSSAGVGEAATAAVVLGILLIIVTDALFTVLFNALRW